jgi:hypothetical protein
MLSNQNTYRAPPLAAEKGRLNKMTRAGSLFQRESGSLLKRCKQTWSRFEKETHKRRLRIPGARSTWCFLTVTRISIYRFSRCSRPTCEKEPWLLPTIFIPLGAPLLPTSRTSVTRATASSRWSSALRTEPRIRSDCERAATMGRIFQEPAAIAGTALAGEVRRRTPARMIAA